MIREIKQETGWDELEKEISDTKSEVNTSLKEFKKEVDITPELKGAAADIKKNVGGIRQEIEQTGKQLKKLPEE